MARFDLTDREWMLIAPLLPTSLVESRGQMTGARLLASGKL